MPSYPKHQIFKLNDGNVIPSPAFGCGTALYEADAADSVIRAIGHGYLHIDSASMYGNEESVGAGLAHSQVSRDKLYITSKYHAKMGAPVETEFDQTLRELGVTYLDLYLIHQPDAAKDGGGIEKVWRAFEQLKKSGKVKSIGVSNYGVAELEELLALAEIKPSVNQIEYHAYNALESGPLLALSNEHGIVTVAYSAFTPITRTPGGPADAAGESIAKRLSEWYGQRVTVGQTILGWLRSTGIAVVTTSSNESRLQELLAVFQDDFPLLAPGEVDMYEHAGPGWSSQQ